MTKVPDFPSTNRCQVRAGGLCQSTVDKATCKPREKTMSAKKRSRPTAPSAAPTGVPAPPRPAALPRPAAADNSTAGRAAQISRTTTKVVQSRGQKHDKEKARIPPARAVHNVLGVVSPFHAGVQEETHALQCV